MTVKKPRRIRLFTDPENLAAFDRESVLARAVPELRERRVDVELRDVEQDGPDSVLVALMLPPTVPDEDIEPDLRSVLGIGPGRYQRGPEIGQMHGVSGAQTLACPVCGYTSGHASNCKYRRR
jgi:hypothetical protein